MSKMRIEQIEIKDANIFEMLLDNFPDMIHSVSDDGKIVYTNKKAEALLGYPRDELIGMNVKQIYAKEILTALENGFQDLKKKGDKQVESLLQAKNGTKIPVEIRSFSIYDDEGSFIRTFSILRDIREIKELQQSLIHAGRLAAIGELSAGVAHDINNPLMVIIFSISMMLRGLSAPEPDPQKNHPRIKSMAEEALKASKSIQKLSEHLRNFSRGISEKHEPINLHDALNDSAFLAGNKIIASGTRLKINIPKDSCYTHGSPNQIEQVFMNLISNACDAMKDSPVRDLTITVSETVHQQIPAWRIEVADTGSGISPENQKNIFQSFFTTKEKGSGTGLGLSISRGIVNEHKGEISVSSQPGAGSTFSVVLPMHRPEKKVPCHKMHDAF